MNNYQTANTDTVTQLNLWSVARAKYRQVDQGLQSRDWPWGRYSFLSNKYPFPQEIYQLGPAPKYSTLSTVEARNMWRYTWHTNASTELCFNTESNSAYRYQHVVKNPTPNRAIFRRLFFLGYWKKIPPIFFWTRRFFIVFTRDLQWHHTFNRINQFHALHPICLGHNLKVCA